ncbi:Twin-arginine translocation protein TatA [Amycolatopsis sp. BJA-103]|uniref:Twin-arginine translocation protein TatA n=1 Tax=Amycolatopsis sp. BJA-103 TaxID=1911175 RepID=UPI000C792FC5|nr:Twin-arginine translocation protein TatA [Amycolatopsis sp. BJA-103]AUI62368.1 Twin-arginine translocation protein TatA [Amycolatopsis sp. BJA-103]PNE20326.1 Twin-arginine translocation protein TatA [Amycolatopsis sp. BJA-103]
MTYPPQPGQPYGQDPQGQQPGGPPQPGGWDQTQQYGQPQQYGQQQGWDQTQQYQQQPQQGWDPNAQQQPQQGWDQTQQYQQPQQGWDPNAQQQGWDPNNPGYPQGYGGPPAPPSKSKTGLIIGIVIGLVVLIAFGVTGFLAPGFLLNKDDGNNTAAPPPASSSSKAPTSAPKSSPKSSAPKSSPKSTESGGTGSEGNPKGVQNLKDFLAKVSAGDKAGALSLVCADMKATMGDSIDIMAPAPSQLEVTSTAGIGDGFITGDIEGTVKGKKVSGSGISSDDNPDKSFCVRNFFVF